MALKKEASESNPPRLALFGLLTNIDAYNKEFQSQWAGIFAGILSQTAPETTDEERRIRQEERIRNAHAELTKLRTLNKSVFDIFGIDISVISLDEQAPKARVRIADARKFTRALESVGGQLDDKSRVTLGRLVGDIEDQVRDTNFRRPDRTDKNVLKNLPEVTNSLKKVDPALFTGRLEKYDEFSKKGTLENYVAVEREGLWKEPGEGFGPADWVGDATPGHLRSLWFKALQILREQERLEEKGVAEELREQLIRSVAVSSEKLSNTRYPEEQKLAMKEVLKEVTERLLVGIKKH